MATKARTAVMMAVTIGVFVFSASAGPPIRYGKFNEADFTPPHFSDGDSATLTAGEARTFTYSCHCANQPRTVPCTGMVILEADDGNGFAGMDSAPCDIQEGEWCSVTYEHTFNFEGTYTFRIVCDEAVGTDYTQDPAEQVVVTVEATGCTDGEMRPCPLQEGVCTGSVETCTGGAWPGCSYGPDYEEPEASCDGLDNDCDGTADNVDLDGDGIGICPGPGIINELLLGFSPGVGSLSIYEYWGGDYHEAWSTTTGDTFTTRGGGEAGDLTGDGVPEFAVGRMLRGSADHRLEVWTYDGSNGWTVLWSTTAPEEFHVGDIIDADNDDANELLVTNRNNDKLELYSWDGNGFSVEAIVHDCGAAQALFHATAADLDGDGETEILFQCYTPEPMYVHEHSAGAYPIVGVVPMPITPLSGNVMVVDDIEAGDVDRDGLPEAVFCGNTGAAHVVGAVMNGTDYTLDYSSPLPVDTHAVSQTCSVGDVTNDGWDDILVVNKEGAKVYSHDGSWYQEVWVDVCPTITPSIAASFVGDADNDGYTEFLSTDCDFEYRALYENDVAGADSFSKHRLFGPDADPIMIVANLNPDNDDETPVDCDDTDPDQGVYEVCGDGLDNDCDTEVDEGCPTNFCGDGYCDGAASGEDCDTCAADCPCIGPGCKHGCCGDYVCSRRENAGDCPVDCS